LPRLEPNFAGDDTYLHADQSKSCHRYPPKSQKKRMRMEVTLPFVWLSGRRSNTLLIIPQSIARPHRLRQKHMPQHPTNLDVITHCHFCIEQRFHDQRLSPSQASNLKSNNRIIIYDELRHPLNASLSSAWNGSHGRASRAELPQRTTPKSAHSIASTMSQPAQPSHPTFINLPGPPSNPDTPSEMP